MYGSTTHFRHFWTRRVSSSRPLAPQKRWGSSKAATPASRSLGRKLQLLLWKRRQKKKCKKPASSGWDAGEAAQWTWDLPRTHAKWKSLACPVLLTPVLGTQGQLGPCDSAASGPNPHRVPGQVPEGQFLRSSSYKYTHMNTQTHTRTLMDIHRTRRRREKEKLKARKCKWLQNDHMKCLLMDSEKKSSTVCAFENRVKPSSLLFRSLFWKRNQEHSYGTG